MSGEQVPPPVPDVPEDDVVALPAPDEEPETSGEPENSDAPEPAVERQTSSEPETSSGPDAPGAPAERDGAGEEPPEAERPAEVEAADAVDGAAPAPRRRRRDPLAAVLIGVLTLLLGFAFAVQVRNADSGQTLAGQREEDLVRILDDVNAREERLREQIAEQRTALAQLNSSDSRSSTALEEARRRAESIGILNGTLAAHGPGLRMAVHDPGDEVRVADVLDAIQELRGAGAETMQIDGIRVGVSTAVTGDPGKLLVDGHPITAPYDFLVIGDPQNMETAMNIPGGVVQRITGLGGSVKITQLQDVVVDALRPLDTPQYASPTTGG